MYASNKQMSSDFFLFGGYFHCRHCSWDSPERLSDRICLSITVNNLAIFSTHGHKLLYYVCLLTVSQFWYCLYLGKLAQSCPACWGGPAVQGLTTAMASASGISTNERRKRRQLNQWEQSRSHGLRQEQSHEAWRQQGRPRVRVRKGQGGRWVSKVWFASSFCAEIFGTKVNVKVNLIVNWGGEDDELSWWKSHDFPPADVWGRSPEVRSPRRATLWQFWSRSESLIRMKGISSYWICNVM